MPPELHTDPSSLDLKSVIADREAIARINPHRFELALLDAVVLLDPEKRIIAGYVDAQPDAFWVRGHFPELPLMPGVLQCEAAAQLCAYYITAEKVFQQDLVALGGLENARFRAPVRPGDRLVLVAKGVRFHRRQTTFNVQGFVNNSMAFHVDIVGMPMNMKGT